MNIPTLPVALLLAGVIVSTWVFLHRLLLDGRSTSSLTLLDRLSKAALYMGFGAIATSLLSVLLSSPAAFADGLFRVLTGAPLFWTLTSAHLMLAFVVVILGAAAIGFLMIHKRAAQSRPFRRFLRGLPASSGRVESEDMKRYPPPPGQDTP